MGKIENILFEETLVGLKIMQKANSLKIIRNHFFHIKQQILPLKIYLK